MAINRKGIAKTVLTPTYRVATGVLAENTPDYVNQSASPQMAYNPDLAKKILTQAGWVPGSDGIRTKNGQRLTVTLTYTNLFSANVPTFELLQQQYKAVGIDFQTPPAPGGAVRDEPQQPELPDDLVRADAGGSGRPAAGVLDGAAQPCEPGDDREAQTCSSNRLRRPTRRRAQTW